MSKPLLQPTVVLKFYKRLNTLSPFCRAFISSFSLLNTSASKERDLNLGNFLERFDAAIVFEILLVLFTYSSFS